MLFFPKRRAVPLGDLRRWCSMSLLSAGLLSGWGPSAQGAVATDSFEDRRDRLIQAVADHRLDKWREGYFTANDPGKYLPGAAMARLLLDPADPDALRLMNDRRAPTEHYHFAAVNWARFLPLFGEALTADTLEKYSQRAANYTAYTQPGGTENHRVMSWSAGGVLPHYLATARFGGLPREEALQVAKEHLRTYVKGLYAAGQGEWDSSTYLLFDINGLLNLYDFSPDPEVRQLADAGLQWLVAAYALKYRDGMFAGPHFRGFTDAPMSENTDQTGWLWWGSRHDPGDGYLRNFFYSIHAATSDWRPNEILTRIARKDLPGLPLSYTATKPNYWHGHRSEPVAGFFHETVYLAPEFTLGSLLNGQGGQITRWELVAETPGGPVHFWGGHPRRSDHSGQKRDHGYTDGIGRYDQLAQSGSCLLHLTMAPPEEEVTWSFVAFPAGSFQQELNGWYIFRVGAVTVAVFPLAERAEIGTIPPGKKAARHHPEGWRQPALKLHGRNNAFVLEAGEDLDPGSLDRPEQVTADPLQVRYTDAAGQTLEIRYRPGERSAAFAINGEAQNPPNQPVYDSPYVHAREGVLTISDGTNGYRIDFTGELPVQTEL